MQLFFVYRFSRFLPQFVNGIQKTSNSKNLMQMANSIRCLCSKPENKSDVQDLKMSHSDVTWKPIYHLPKIMVASIAHRVKFYQSIFTIATLPLSFGFYYYGKTNLTTVLVVTGAASFTCLSLYVLTSFFTRLIGIIYIDQNQKYLKIAHLTFWGRRKDIFIPVEEIVPLTDCDCNPLDAFVKVHRTNSDEAFYMTLRFGKILDKDVFEKVFGSFKLLKFK